MLPSVYDQCSNAVKEKLEETGDWDKMQREQLLHDLICKIERICVGFNNHKQEVFNLVQALKTLFLYTQLEKESIKEYRCNFKSLWETVEAFVGGSPGVHKGLVDGLLAQTGWVANPGSPTAAERKQAEVDALEAVKAALLISGANKQ
jgi:hypothetical protein